MTLTALHVSVAPTGKRSSSGDSGGGVSANQLLGRMRSSSKGPLSKDALAQDWKQLARGIAEAEAEEVGGGRSGSSRTGSRSSRNTGASSRSKGVQDRRPWKQRGEE